MIGLYLHIPFCATLCPYCDFVKARGRPEDRAAFVEALLHEIATCDAPREASTVFFGGGTPSLLTPAQLGAILEALHRRFDLAADAEVSLEANPEDITPTIAAAWHALGITRVSIGVQSLDDPSLRYLGRNHDAASARAACEAVAAVFPDWSLDLIFGLPAAEGWEITLAAAQALDPPHLSGYGLTYEPRTPFARRTHDAVEDAEYVRQYWAIAQALPRLQRYEVSNLAAPGHACAHNLIYWRNEAYAGFGPGAYSFLGGVRARNHPAIRRWREAPGEKAEALPLARREQQTETLIQGLRLAEGIAHTRYEARFGVPIRQDFAAPMDALLARGLIEDSGTALRPTPAGFEWNDDIGLALVDPDGPRAP